MFCNSCGAAVPENAAHCPNCGAAQTAAKEVAVNVSSITPKSVLTMGILSLAFASSFFISILGIIFGAIGKGKAKTYYAQGGIESTQVKLGKIFSTIGLIVGIVMSVICLIYIVVLIVALASY